MDFAAFTRLSFSFIKVKTNPISKDFYLKRSYPFQNFLSASGTTLMHFGRLMRDWKNRLMPSKS
jgi:hypothetical protein